MQFVRVEVTLQNQICTTQSSTYDYLSNLSATWFDCRLESPDQTRSPDWLLNCPQISWPASGSHNSNLGIRLTTWPPKIEDEWRSESSELCRAEWRRPGRQEAEERDQGTFRWAASVSSSLHVHLLRTSHNSWTHQWLPEKDRIEKQRSYWKTERCKWNCLSMISILHCSVQ